MKVSLKDFCREIINCLIKYGQIEEAEALNLVTASGLCTKANENENNFMFHETPYYWAMTILYPNNPNWYQDTNLWPPPKEHLEKWYPKKHNT